jgi:DNA-binding MarR family transcriptional regulator
MERLGLVSRVREEPDRRTVHIELTETGRQRVDDVFAEVVSADEELLVGLDAAERRTLERLLRRWLSLRQVGWTGADASSGDVDAKRS